MTTREARLQRAPAAKRPLSMRTAAVLLTGAVAAACGRFDDAPPAVGTLERDRIELVAESDEPIVAIEVTEGDAVTAGQLLLALDSAVVDARLAQARAAHARTEQRFAELVRGPRRERILEARARVEGARENSTAQQREHERIAALVARQLVSPSQLDQALARREVAAAELKAAEAELLELTEGTTAEELAQAEAAVSEAKAATRVLEIAAARLQVRAPRAGRVEALPYELGERPPPRATVAVLLADGAPYVRAYVPAALRSRVTAGLEAQIHADGIEQVFSGRVRYVSAEAAFTPYFALTQRDRGRLSYLAEITLTDSAAADLPTGIPVEVVFPTLAPPE
jgi:HlyD family secretion protein